jgi:transcription elongation factor GreA
MAELISASEASNHFLSSLDPDKARDERAVVTRFVEWFGEERALTDLTGEDVTGFAEREDGDETAMEPIRAFLAYCSRMAFTGENLVPYLRMAGGARGGRGAEDELGGNAYYVTIDGVAALEQELEELKAQRPRIAEELHAAMADKDFRENAPLDAARDAQGHLEARIRTAEEGLRHAVIIDEETKAGRANVGSTVRVLNLDANKEQLFHLVSSAEVDPASGKISVESPVGAAMIDRGPGDEVTVRAPSGTTRLRVIEVIG